jgi:hypothetical protein
MSFWMTRYRKLSGSKLGRGTPIRFMRWVLVWCPGNTRNKSVAVVPCNAKVFVLQTNT